MRDARDAELGVLRLCDLGVVAGAAGAVRDARKTGASVSFGQADRVGRAGLGRLQYQVSTIRSADDRGEHAWIAGSGVDGRGKSRHRVIGTVDIDIEAGAAQGDLQGTGADGVRAAADASVF